MKEELSGSSLRAKENAKRKRECEDRELEIKRERKREQNKRSQKKYRERQSARLAELVTNLETIKKTARSNKGKESDADIIVRLLDQSDRFSNGLISWQKKLSRALYTIEDISNDADDLFYSLMGKNPENSGTVAKREHSDEDTQSVEKGPIPLPSEELASDPKSQTESPSKTQSAAQTRSQSSQLTSDIDLNLNCEEFQSPGFFDKIPGINVDIPEKYLKKHENNNYKPLDPIYQNQLSDTSAPRGSVMGFQFHYNLLLEQFYQTHKGQHKTEEIIDDMVKDYIHIFKKLEPRLGTFAMLMGSDCWIGTLIKWHAIPTLEVLQAIQSPFSPTTFQLIHQSGYDPVIDFIMWPQVRDRLIYHNQKFDLPSTLDELLSNVVIPTKLGLYKVLDFEKLLGSENILEPDSFLFDVLKNGIRDPSLWRLSPSFALKYPYLVTDDIVAYPSGGS